MAEYEKTEATASFHQEADHNEEHDDRDVPVSYADPSRECDNIYYEKNMTKEEAFIYLFENSINEYNDSQPRKDRQYLTEKIDENGKVVEACMEPGRFTYDNTIAPSFLEGEGKFGERIKNVAK